MIIFLSTAKTTTSCYDLLKNWFNELNEEVDIPSDLYDRFENILSLYEEKLKH